MSIITARAGITISRLLRLRPGISVRGLLKRASHQISRIDSLELTIFICCFVLDAPKLSLKSPLKLVLTVLMLYCMECAKCFRLFGHGTRLFEFSNVHPSCFTKFACSWILIRLYISILPTHSSSFGSLTPLMPLDNIRMMPARLLLLERRHPGQEFIKFLLFKMAIIPENIWMLGLDKTLFATDVIVIHDFIFHYT